MPTCASVRKVGSKDKCPSPALLNHTLCGRHARCKKVVKWTDVYASHTRSLVRTQALVRGWLLRNRLKLSGPGVLARKHLTNEEDPVTLERREDVHPFSYFGLEEHGKVFWFEFETIYKWCLRSHTPSNPFTKVPLSREARVRLREGWSYRQRHRMSVPSEPTTYNERLMGRWNIICQLFEDQGFGEMDPDGFARMTKQQYRTAFLFMRDDIPVVLPPKNQVRTLLDLYCARGARVASTMPADRYALQVAYTMLLILTRQKDPYTLSFVALSAFYRC